MSRHAVHKNRVRHSTGHERVIDLIGREDLCPLSRLIFLSHTGPHISVSGVSAGDGRAWIFHDLDLRAGLGCDSKSCRSDVGIRTISRWSSNREFAAYAGSSEHERMSHVVAIAHVSDVDLAQVSEFLLQSEEVGQGLAGMLNIAQSIDYGNACVTCHF